MLINGLFGHDTTLKIQPHTEKCRMPYSINHKQLTCHEITASIYSLALTFYVNQTTFDFIIWKVVKIYRDRWSKRCLLLQMDSDSIGLRFRHRSLASSLFTGTEQSLWCRPCSRWLRWRFSAWWPLVQLETAVALLQRLFRAGACTRTNHVFATMRSLQCNQCQDSMRQINPNGFQSLCYSMYDYDFVAINIFELSWVE